MRGRKGGRAGSCIDFGVGGGVGDMSKCAAPYSLARSLLSLHPPPSDCLSSPDRLAHLRRAALLECPVRSSLDGRSVVPAVRPSPSPSVLLLGPLPLSFPPVCSDRCRRLRATLPKLNVALIAPSLTPPSPNSRSLASGAWRRRKAGKQGRGTTERNEQSVGRRFGPAYGRRTSRSGGAECRRGGKQRTATAQPLPGAVAERDGRTN